MNFYAHTKSLADGSLALEPDWEPLDVHLREVSELAGKFADAFGAKEWGELAGSWHDLGKYSNEFQQYLRARSFDADPHIEDTSANTVRATGSVDHSTAGAQYSALNKPLGPLLSYVIAGHHAGLPDGIPKLRERLLKNVPDWKMNCSIEGSTLEMPELPLVPKRGSPPGEFRIAFFLRMVFSALVDADFICTERFMSPETAAQRQQWPDDLLGRMEGVLLDHLDSFGSPETRVDVERLHVRNACESASHLEPGFFDLTVPTGGGKTLASLLFALRHARIHGLRRVVCAIPYTSIIEQNAKVYRDVFADLSRELGAEIVLEHHSSLLPTAENTRNRLTTENWDAPLIVTTNVQLFESLYASRTSACRKLHRLSESVIILDEAQALPVGLLRPILTALRCLVMDCRCSVVLCTATQPALEERADFTPGIPSSEVRSVVDERERLYESLRRTTVTILGPQTNEDLRERVLAETSGCLVIVNTTAAAREFYSSLESSHENRFHLSGRMCADHRSVVLENVKRMLSVGRPVVLVSTQLIEAGVDVSFPAVFRAECGLDSLAQAAGRCNRNGELRDADGGEMRGKVYTFQHSGYEIPSQLTDLRDAASDARQIIPDHRADILAITAIERYFRLHIWSVGQRTNQWDDASVMDCFPRSGSDGWQYTMKFSEAARKFQMIPQLTKAIVVPFGDEGKRTCQEFRDRERRGLPPSKQLYRRAQRCLVQVFDREYQQLVQSGRVETVHDGAINLLVHPENDYGAEFGLRPPNQPGLPSAFII